MANYSTDAMIYSALASVDLQANFFNSYGNPKPEEIENLRDEFREARRFILSGRRGHWSYRQLTLINNTNLEAGWYYYPQDWIAWYRPMPNTSGADKSGVPIVQFSGNQVLYVFDREDMAGMPIELIALVKQYFLYKLLPRAIISQQKAAIVTNELRAVDAIVKQMAAIDQQSKQHLLFG